MTTDFAAVLAEADDLQAGKAAATAPRPTLVGAGPDRPMPYIAAIPARELFVDHAYQRPLDHPRVRRMVEAWDPTMLGVLDVSDRGPDSKPRYAVIAGQHRLEAAAAADPRGEDVPLVCNVHRGLTPATEAALMHELDRTQKKLVGHDQWRARRAAGDLVVEAVEQVASAHGLTVGPAYADGWLRSYGAAEKLMKLGGSALLDETLGVLQGAYGLTAAAYQAPLLTAVGTYLHGSEVDVPRLVRALAANRPEQLRAQAAALREIEAGTLAQLLTRVIGNQYRRTSARP